MASNALAPLVYQLQHGLRNVDLRNFINTDIGSWLGKLDIKTVGLVALAVLAVLFVLDFYTKSSPYRRNLAASTTPTSDNTHDLNQALSGRRSLESLTQVLNSLAEAVKEWEGPENVGVRNRAF